MRKLNIWGFKNFRYEKLERNGEILTKSEKKWGIKIEEARKGVEGRVMKVGGGFRGSENLL